MNSPPVAGERGIVRLTVSGYVCLSVWLRTYLPKRAGVMAFGRNRPVFYRVRGVDASCAQHLAVESYTVVILLTFILIIISIPSPLSPQSFISGLKPSLYGHLCP